MPAGLDAWPCGKQECPTEPGWLIREERLESRLGVTHFRLPPDHRESDSGTRFANQNVPFVRFPRWHYCHHCGGMELVSPFAATRERCRGRAYQQQSCAAKPQYRRPHLIPVRFVAVCDIGHIQDFPFIEWLHRDVPPGPECKLRMRAGRSSAGLSGITIECSCNQKRSLGDVFKFDEDEGGPLARIGCDCKGLRPWLGDTDAGAAPCGRFLRVLQRGGTNVYFPHVVSAIYLPLWAEDVSAEIISILEDSRAWALLSQGTVDGRVDSERCRIIAGLAGVDAGSLERAAQHKLEGSLTSREGQATDEEDFRRYEYQAICDGKVGPQSELYVECRELSSYEPLMARFFRRIRLVHKLRETRALAGFTRLLPPDGTLSSERLQSLKMNPGIDWLPAIKVYGEGIFLELNIDELARWVAAANVVPARVTPLVSRYNAARTSRLQPIRNISIKFLVMHTLSHVIINQLSFDCGYGSASLRERLYCEFADTGRPMQGIMIYTASGDSEGTMGGLVRQGRPGRLEPTLRRALRRAAWCSSDPVCLETRGQGPDSANLAACHGCCLLSETSCEEGNRLLDRGLLVGTPDSPELGLFRSAP